MDNEPYLPGLFTHSGLFRLLEASSVASCDHPLTFLGTSLSRAANTSKGVPVCTKGENGYEVKFEVVVPVSGRLNVSHRFFCDGCGLVIEHINASEEEQSPHLKIYPRSEAVEVGKNRPKKRGAL